MTAKIAFNFGKIVRFFTWVFTVFIIFISARELYFTMDGMYRQCVADHDLNTFWTGMGVYFAITILIVGPIFAAGFEFLTGIKIYRKKFLAISLLSPIVFALHLSFITIENEHQVVLVLLLTGWYTIDLSLKNLKSRQII